MQYIPPIILMLIAASVGTLQLRKARRFDGLKRRLSFGVMASNYVTALALLAVVVFDGFDWPGPGIVIMVSILLSIALWTAGMIWTGPAEKEDKQVFQVTVGLMGVLVLSGILAGLVG